MNRDALDYLEMNSTGTENIIRGKIVIGQLHLTPRFKSAEGIWVALDENESGTLEITGVNQAAAENNRKGSFTIYGRTDKNVNVSIQVSKKNVDNILNGRAAINSRAVAFQPRKAA